MFTFAVVFKLYFRLHKFPSFNRHIGTLQILEFAADAFNAKNISLLLVRLLVLLDRH